MNVNYIQLFFINIHLPIFLNLRFLFHILGFILILVLQKGQVLVLLNIVNALI